MDYSKVVSKESIDKTVESLNKNNIQTIVVSTGVEAKEKALSMLPEGAEVMNMTSVTLDSLGISKEIQESGKYVSLRNKLFSLDRATQGKEMHQVGATPDYVIGSVHAITEDGKIFVASGSGSQLPAYSYGATKVIFVIGAQKIVKDSEDAMKRIYDYTLPLESKRAHEAYGVPGSAVNELLIINNNPVPERITVIIVNESLGF